MENLSISELNSLRILILKNAQALSEEAKVLYAHEMYSRAYLLAHFCIEELGKLPIIVGVVANLSKNEEVDWKKVKKRFCNHKEKIASQNGHFYAFSLATDLKSDSDVEWLLNANNEIHDKYSKKNISTYVDVVKGKVIDPLAEISKVDADKLINYAVACISGHDKSEALINPIIYNASTSL